MLNVLIVDDDEHFGRIVARTLRRTPDVLCQPVTSAAQAREAVQQADPPFDVFLIDQRLGPGCDGIDLMADLLRQNHESTAIVFTLANDTEAGLRAYRAGAYRYLHKPLRPDDLVVALQSLREWRDTRRARDGLLILADIAKQAQQARTIHELGLLIVHGGCQFGFQRARLWLLADGSDTMLGCCQYGDHGGVLIEQLALPIEQSIYARQSIASRQPLIFRGEELGPSYVSQIVPNGFQRPLGEWVSIPLWGEQRCLGMLTLDNHSEPTQVRRELLQQLTLFGQQASAALVRIQLYEDEQRASNQLAAKTRELEQTSLELQAVASIGRLIANRAATTDLLTLLGDVRELVNQFLDAHHFMVVLRDQAADLLDVRLDIAGTHVRRRSRLPLSTGLVGFVVRNNMPLQFGQGSRDVRVLHKIRRFGREARSWLGVPLQVEGAAVGAIVVQSYDRADAYTDEDQRLLGLVADQVAGVIEAARLKDEAAANNKRLIVLQRASAQLLRLVEENEEWFWHAALTVITAGYALGFNRAALFLTKGDRTALYGRLGIGQFDGRRARYRWKHDLRTRQDLTTYLRQLRNGQIEPTEIDAVVRQFEFVIEAHPAFAEALRSASRVVVSAADAGRCLPAAFMQHFGRSEYAVLPLLMGDKVFGVVVVDNQHNHEPISSAPLGQLETWLAQVAIVFKNQRRRDANDKLIAVNHAVLAQVANQPLRDTLQQICTAAQTITEADSVVIYPTLTEPASGALLYDHGHAGSVGLRQPLRLHQRPSENGTTVRVLRSGRPLVSECVAREPWFDPQRYPSHSFLVREAIQAFIGVPVVEETTGAVLGALYLNYHTPRSFGDSDVQRARLFAQFAGSAIKTSRAEQGLKDSRDAAEQLSLAREHELELLSDVLRAALRPHINRDQMISGLLNAVCQLLGVAPAQTTLILRGWSHPEDPSHEPEELRRVYQLQADDRIREYASQNLYIGITGTVFRSGQSQRIADTSQPPWSLMYQPLPQLPAWQTRSELDVAIQLDDHQVLGVFNVESALVGAFSEEHLLRLRRLAAVAALALDNVQRQDNLSHLLRVARAVVLPADLTTTLNAVLEAARQAAPGVSVVTIWYKDALTGQIECGPFFGVHHPERMNRAQPSEESTVGRIMRSRGPIWAVDAQSETRLSRRFVFDEGIVSAAAIPMVAENDIVGTIFFNYRHYHAFNQQEYLLFPTIATIAAASVRDALRLDKLQTSQQQLKAVNIELEQGNARLRAASNINQAIGATLAIGETLRRILATLGALFATARPAILIYDDRLEMLTFAPASFEFYQIEHPDRVGWLPIKGERAIACRLARRARDARQILCENIGDVSSDPNYLEAISSTRSQICVSLMRGDGGLLGVLVLESDRLDAFGEQDAELVLGVAPAISTALERATQSESLQFKNTVLARTAWAAEIAHDINKEISVIRGRTHLLKPKLSTGDQRLAAEIDASAAQLAEHASVPHTMPQEPIVLDAWLETNIREFVRPRGEGIKLEFRLNGGAARVLAAPLLLERALRHLVRNALEAMHYAGTLYVCSLCRDQRTIEVLLLDSGPGVPDSIRHQLFSTQVSTKQQPGDTEGGGLGLLFVRAAIEDMGGTISLLPSKKIRGASFMLSLPLAQP